MKALESNPGKTSSMKCSSCRGCCAPGAEDGGAGGTMDIVARWSCASSPKTTGGIAEAVTAVAA